MPAPARAAFTRYETGTSTRARAGTRVHSSSGETARSPGESVPARAREGTRVPHSSFSRNEGVLGSSPSVGFLAYLQGVLSAADNVAAAAFGASGGLRVRNGYVMDPFSVPEVVPFQRRITPIAGDSLTRGHRLRVPFRAREFPQVDALPSLLVLSKAWSTLGVLSAINCLTLTRGSITPGHNACSSCRQAPSRPRASSTWSDGALVADAAAQIALVPRVAHGCPADAGFDLPTDFFHYVPRAVFENAADDRPQSERPFADA